MDNEKRLFLGALMLKVCAGLAITFLYLNYFGGGDSLVYFTEAKKIDEYLTINSLNSFHFLLNHESLDGLSQSLTFRNQPSALLFNKMVYVFYQLSGGNIWLISICFSLLSFSGFWIFYRSVSRTALIPHHVLVIALFFWPSVVFWSSGLVKESVSTFLILVIISCMVWIVRKPKKWFFLIGVVASCSYVLFMIKYYYSAVLIPCIATYLICLLAKKVSKKFAERAYLQLTGFFVVFVVFIFLASNLHYNLRLENIVEVVVENYRLFEGKSEPEKMVVFENLSPSFRSLLVHSPKALFAGLFRPNVFDIENLWSGLAAIENFLLLVLAVFQLKNIPKIRKRHFLIVTTTIVFCCVMALLLSFSAPNLGTLVRYKVGFLPLFLILVLSGNPFLTRIVHRLVNRSE